MSRDTELQRLEDGDIKGEQRNSPKQKDTCVIDEVQVGCKYNSIDRRFWGKDLGGLGRTLRDTMGSMATRQPGGPCFSDEAQERGRYYGKEQIPSQAQGNLFTVRVLALPHTGSPARLG